MEVRPTEVPILVSDSQWARVAPLLRQLDAAAGASTELSRAVLSALLYLAFTGYDRAELPAGYPPAGLVQETYTRWQRSGLLDLLSGVLLVQLAARGEQPESTEAAVTSGRVLVVDDDPDIRAIVRLVLEEEGYAVVLASNGQEALIRVAEDRPRLVLLDLTMPVMNGWQCNNWLQDTVPDLPVIFMSAGLRARQEAEAHRAAGYLSKPFDLAELVSTVRRLAS